MNLLGYLFTQRFLSDNDSLPSSLRLICPGQGYRLLGQFIFSLLAQINLGGQVGDAQVKPVFTARSWLAVWRWSATPTTRR